MSKTTRIKDKWRNKKWYVIVAPRYFGGVEIGSAPTDEPEKLVGRIVEATLYDITGDFAHQYLKTNFQVTQIDGKKALTIFKGHEYSRDYLRSLIRRRTTRIDGIFNITTKDNYKMRISACAFALGRIKTSQEKEIRTVMKKIVDEKAVALTFDQLVQEAVLGKIASDIYNEAKKISPLRHVGIRKTKLVSWPQGEIELKPEPEAPNESEAEVPSEASTESER